MKKIIEEVLALVEEQDVYVPAGAELLGVKQFRDYWAVALFLVDEESKKSLLLDTWEFRMVPTGEYRIGPHWPPYRDTCSLNRGKIVAHFFAGRKFDIQDDE